VRIEDIKEPAILAFSSYKIKRSPSAPSWVGQLAGVALELPVYHIMELEIRAQIDPKVYAEHLGLMEIALDVGKIAQALSKVRGSSQTS
jgi:hypothetical protein